MANSMRSYKTFGVRGKQRVGSWPLLSTTTCKVGDFLVIDAAGKAAVAAASNNPVGATSTNTNRILGRATEESHDENGTIRTVIHFIIAEPGTEFEVPIYHATQASAVATPATDPLTAFELYNVGGVWAVDISETTDVKCKIVDYNTEDLPTWPDAVTAGTVLNPRVWIEFMPAHCFTGIAS